MVVIDNICMRKSIVQHQIYGHTQGVSMILNSLFDVFFFTSILNENLESK